MARTLLERLTNSATMLEAEDELLNLRADAITIIASVLTGEAANEFGTPYRELGLPLRCVLEVAIRLGPISRPLEPLLRAELERGDFVAAQALGALDAVADSSIEALAGKLDYETNRQKGFPRALDLACESAAALIRLNHESHPAVGAALARSPRASSDFARTKALMSKKRGR